MPLSLTPVTPVALTLSTAAAGSLTLASVSAGGLSLAAATGLAAPTFITQEPSGRLTLESGAGFILLEGSNGLSFDPSSVSSLSLSPA